jgi:hypothetical protein
MHSKDIQLARFSIRYQDKDISFNRVEVYVKLESDCGATISKVSLVNQEGTSFTDLHLESSNIITGFLLTENLSVENGDSVPEGGPGAWTIKASQ